MVPMQFEDNERRRFYQNVSSPTIADVYCAIHKVYQLTILNNEGAVAHTIKKNGEHLYKMNKEFQESLSR